MVFLWASDGTSNAGLKAVKAIHAADDTGQVAEVKSAWYYTGTEFKRIWPNYVSIDSFTATAGTPTHSQIVLSWAGSNVTTYRLYVDSLTSAPVYTGTATTFTFTGNPSTKYKFYLQADGPITLTTSGTITSDAIDAATTAVNAPTGLVYSGLTYNGATLKWNSVAGATSYDLVNTATNTVVAGGNDIPTSSASGFPISLGASTKYSLAVRANVGSYTSANSNVISFTSPALPGPAKGTYYFKPKSAYTWQTGESGGASAGWRSSSDDYYHGNGNAYGSSRGNQTTFFFYGTNPFASLKGGSIVSIQMYIKRQNTTHGSSAAADSRMRRHKYDAKPSGTPVFEDYITVDTNLSRGEGIWMTLPDSWASSLISGAESGLAWGGSTSAYMIADRNLGAATPNGTIRITIG